MTTLKMQYPTPRQAFAGLHALIGFAAHRISSAAWFWAADQRTPGLAGAPSRTASEMPAPVLTVRASAPSGATISAREAQPARAMTLR